jgi:hypothetical protein
MRTVNPVVDTAETAQQQRPKVPAVDVDLNPTTTRGTLAKGVSKITDLSTYAPDVTLVEEISPVWMTDAMMLLIPAVNSAADISVPGSVTFPSSRMSV